MGLTTSPSHALVSLLPPFLLIPVLTVIPFCTVSPSLFLPPLDSFSPSCPLPSDALLTSHPVSASTHLTLCSSPYEPLPSLLIHAGGRTVAPQDGHSRQKSCPQSSPFRVLQSWFAFSAPLPSFLPPSIRLYPVSLVSKPDEGGQSSTQMATIAPPSLTQKLWACPHLCTSNWGLTGTQLWCLGGRLCRYSLQGRAHVGHTWASTFKRDIGKLEQGFLKG